jgi:hypothetical protein
MNLPEWAQNIRADVAVFGAAGGIIAFALKPTRRFAPAFVQVFGGFCVAVVGTPFINLWWPIPSDQLYAGVAFLLGVSGLGIIRGIPKIVPPLFFKGLELLLSFRKDDAR